MEMRLKDIAAVFVRLAVRFRFELPPYYTLLLRSLATLEGIALTADPSFQMMRAALPAVQVRITRYQREPPTQRYTHHTVTQFVLSWPLNARAEALLTRGRRRRCVRRGVPPRASWCASSCSREGAGCGGTASLNWRDC
jgi:predicted unusual protein kinase regulating ubiquinone biosynthesis (AarF/ABC1/UbiB family)